MHCLNGKTRNNFRANDNRNVIPLRPTIFDSVINLMVGGVRGVAWTVLCSAGCDSKVEHWSFTKPMTVCTTDRAQKA